MARLALDSVTDSVLKVVQPELSDSYSAEGKPVQLLSVGVPLLALTPAAVSFASNRPWCVNVCVSVCECVCARVCFRAGAA